MVRNKRVFLEQSAPRDARCCSITLPSYDGYWGAEDAWCVSRYAEERKIWQFSLLGVYK
jgi:hypothetical protein